MGVSSLWKLLEGEGKPLALEALANKRLAIDASIWLHQFLKAMRDKDGNTLYNAHIMGFFRRICKLLFYNIKPVFVFDGGVPPLKMHTIGARKKQRERSQNNLQSTAERLLASHLKLQALNSRENEEDADGAGDAVELRPPSPPPKPRWKRKRDDYELPSPQKMQAQGSAEADFESNESEDGDVDPQTLLESLDPNTLNALDIDSNVFESLPSDIQHEIMTLLKDKSRQSSWRRVKEMLAKSKTALDFSQLQIENLVRRNMLTKKLEKVTNQMSSVGPKVETNRVAAEQNREYVLVKNTESSSWTMKINASPEKNKRQYHQPHSDHEDDDEDFEKVPVKQPYSPSRKDFMADKVSVDAIMKRFAEAEKKRGGDKPHSEGPQGVTVSRPMFYQRWLKSATPEFRSEFPNFLFLLHTAINQDKLEDVQKTLEGVAKTKEKATIGAVPTKRSVAFEFYENFLAETIVFKMQEQEIADSRKSKDWRKDWAFKLQGHAKDPISKALPLVTEAEVPQLDMTLDFEYEKPDSERQLRRDLSPIAGYLSDLSDDNSDLGDGPEKELIKQIPANHDANAGGFIVDDENVHDIEPTYDPLVVENATYKDFETKMETTGRYASDFDVDECVTAEILAKPLSFLPQNQSKSMCAVTASCINNLSTPHSPDRVPDGKEAAIARTAMEYEKSTPIETEMSRVNIKASPVPEKQDTKQIIHTHNALDTDVKNSEETSSDIPSGKGKLLHDSPSYSHTYGPEGQFGARKGEDDAGKQSYASLLCSDQYLEVISDHHPEYTSQFENLCEEVNSTEYPFEEDLVQEIPSKEAPVEEDPIREALVVEVRPVEVDSFGEKPLELDSKTGKVEPAEVEPVEVEPAELEPVEVEPVEVEPVEVEPIEVGFADGEPDQLRVPEEQQSYSSGKPADAHNIEPAPIAMLEQQLAPADSSAQDGYSISKRNQRNADEGVPLSEQISRMGATHPVTEIYAGTDVDEPYDEMHIDVADMDDGESKDMNRFLADLNDRGFGSMRENLNSEIQVLRNQAKRDKRDITGLNNDMIMDCQEMLRIFGIPYITAPMEAEAQCAKLEQLGLVDGVITDDSDIFLFGGNVVFRHMFNQTKYVECYKAPDIERNMKLNRDRLIALAYLLGSDYTEGINGVGAVLAIEILVEWMENDAEGDAYSALRKFRAWWKDVAIKGGEDSRKHIGLRKRLSKMARVVEFPASFPDARIREAYLHPAVDDSQDLFEWGWPDLSELRIFLNRKLSWSPNKVDQAMDPVMKHLMRNKVNALSICHTDYL